MAEHSIELRASPLDFVPGDKTIMPAWNKRGEGFANRLFDSIFPRISSGSYYHYLTLEAFRQVAKHGTLRFFSTKKLNSEGEFIPFCQDQGLDGYWRREEDGQVAGEHANLMDDLFYKSFVDNPDTNSDKLWDTFAGGGTGVRIKVQITVSPDYPDFRRVAYQGSPAIEAFAALLEAFRSSGQHFVPFGISRMPAYHQLKEYAYQNECRLIVKRHPGADCFPFQVGRDEEQDCNYIDCSLREPTCSFFRLELLDVSGGPACKLDQMRLNELLASAQGSAGMEKDDESADSVTD